MEQPWLNILNDEVEKDQEWKWCKWLYSWFLFVWLSWGKMHLINLNSKIVMFSLWNIALVAQNMYKF